MATPRQRVQVALERERKAQKILNNPRSSKKAKAKAAYERKLARRQQRRGYSAAHTKIKMGGKGKSKDAVRKGNKSKKKSSTRGKKTKNTSKRTRTRSSRGSKGRKKRKK